MKEKIEVSVVIPIYNGMPYLQETIEAILNQTYKEFELILINDGSSDSSESYIQSLNDSRIVYVSQNNMGLCNSLNKAFSLAKGKYIIRNDQDDVSEKDRIEKQVKALESSDYDCIFSYITKVSEEKEWNNIDKIKVNTSSLRDFQPWKDGCMVNSTMAIKKDIFSKIGGYRQAYYPSDDWDLELRLSQNFNVGILEESLLKYRFHESANTYKYWQLMQDARRWAEDSFFKREKNLDELTFKEFLNFEKKDILNYINRRRKDKAKLYMRKAGSAFLTNDYMKLILFLFMTSIFDPKAITLRGINLIKNRLFR